MRWNISCQIPNVSSKLKSLDSDTDPVSSSSLLLLKHLWISVFTLCNFLPNCAKTHTLSVLFRTYSSWIKGTSAGHWTPGFEVTLCLSKTPVKEDAGLCWWPSSQLVFEVSQHLSWCQRQYPWKQRVFSWILWRGGAARGHPRSVAGSAGGCGLAALTRVCWYGPTHPICQCSDSSTVAGVNGEGMREKQWQLLPEGRRWFDGRKEPSGDSFAWFCFHSRWGRKCYLG